MPLILAPSFDEHTREEIEAHIAQVQATRMVAAVEYHRGQSLKLEHEADKIQRRVANQYEMLGKELDRLDKAHDAVTKRLTTLTALHDSLSLTRDMIVQAETATGE